MESFGMVRYVYQTEQARTVIKYVREQYGDELEYLWRATPEDAIWRTRVNRKWYGILFALSARKLGIGSDEWIEVIDLRYQKEQIAGIVDGARILPGYHMNKNNWITVILDGRLDTKEIFRLVGNSYQIALTKK